MSVKNYFTHRHGSAQKLCFGHMSLDGSSPKKKILPTPSNTFPSPCFPYVVWLLSGLSDGFQGAMVVTNGGSRPSSGGVKNASSSGSGGTGKSYPVKVEKAGEDILHVVLGRISLRTPTLGRPSNFEREQVGVCMCTCMCVMFLCDMSVCACVYVSTGLRFVNPLGVFFRRQFFPFLSMSTPSQSCDILHLVVVSIALLVLSGSFLKGRKHCNRLNCNVSEGYVSVMFKGDAAVTFRPKLMPFLNSAPQTRVTSWSPSDHIPPLTVARLIDTEKQRSLVPVVESLMLSPSTLIHTRTRDVQTESYLSWKNAVFSYDDTPRMISWCSLITCIYTGIDLPRRRSHGAVHRAEPISRERQDLEPHLLRREQTPAEQRALLGENQHSPSFL